MSYRISKEKRAEAHEFKPILILGAGSWGSALALHLAKSGQSVRLWSYEVSEIANLLAERVNNQYLPGFPFPDSIYPTANLVEGIKDVEDILIAVPSIAFRETLGMLRPIINQKIRLICATKGLDAETGQLLHQSTADVLGTDYAFAVLSGPSFAREVAAEHPTAVVVASTDMAFKKDIVKRFSNPRFHIDLSDDVIGVEVSSVIKNVIAIATGISDGLGFGANTRCAIITRGYNEMIQLGLRLGANIKTFVGLAGIGDLILTASDNQSRNRRLGLGIGQGKAVSDIEKEIGQIVEGKRNAELVMQFAKRYEIAMPVCEAVNAILREEINTQEAFTQLFLQEEMELVIP